MNDTPAQTTRLANQGGGGAFGDDDRFMFRGGAVGVAATFGTGGAQNEAPDNRGDAPTVWASGCLPSIGGRAKEESKGPQGNAVLSFQAASTSVEGLIRGQSSAKTSVEAEVRGLEIRLPEYGFVFRAPVLRASLSSDYNLEKNRGHPDREFDIFLEEPFDPEGMTIKIGDAEERNLNITWNHELLRISKHKDLKRLYWRLKLHRSPSVRKWLEHFSPAGLIKGLFRFKFRRKVIYSMASVEDNQCPGIEFKWHRLGVPDLTNPELELRFGEVLKEFNSTRLTVVRAILNRRPGQGGQARVRASGPNRASMAALQEFDPTSGTVTAIELESNGHGHP